MRNSSDDLTNSNSKISENYQDILNSLLNYCEKENPENDLSFKW